MTGFAPKLIALISMLTTHILKSGTISQGYLIEAWAGKAFLIQSLPARRFPSTSIFVGLRMNLSIKRWLTNTQNGYILM